MKHTKLLFGLMMLLYSVSAAGTFNQGQIYGDWRLSSTLTNNELGVRLFGATRSQTSFSYLTEQGFRVPVIVVSDPAWNRLVYAVFDNIWAHDGQFTGGLASTPERLIFAPDVASNRVWILYFNHESLPPVNPPPGYVNTGSGPRDVCYDDGGTAAFGDDFFWVVHVNEGTAKKFSYSFDPVYRTFTSQQCAIISGLNSPISIARGREVNNSCDNCDEYAHNEWLYVLEDNGTIKCYTNNQVPPGNDPNITFQFSYIPSGSTLLRSLTVDHTGIIWGTDVRNSSVVTFYNNESALIELDRFGSYGVDNSPGQLLFPSDVSFSEGVARDVEYPEILHIYVSIDAAIQERWSETTGGLRGSRGVGILNFTADWIYPRDYENRPVKINYFTTAFAGNTINILDSSNPPQNIRSIYRSDIPGDVELIWDGKDDNGGQAPIDLYTISLRDNEITFNTNSRPVINYCNFDPTGCFDEDDDSRAIRASVSDPDGETLFKYHWLVESGDIHRDGVARDPLCQELIYNDGGDSRIIFHPPFSWLTDVDDNISIALTIYDQIQNSAIQYNDGTLIDAKRCVQCPNFYILNDTDTLRQNNILNASIDTSGGGHLVFDYLFLSDAPQPNAGKYEFFIREDDNAVDSLDWVSLVTIDHEPGGNLVLSRKGTLYDVLLSVPPSSAVDDQGVNVLQDLLYPDGVFYSREDSGWLDLTYEGLDTVQLGLESMSSGTTVPQSPKAGTGMVTERPNPNILTVSVKDSVGDWQDIERIFSRKRPQPSFVDLTDYFSPSVQIRYNWSVKYTVDYIGYNWVKPVIDGINIVNPTTAFLNDSLNVLNRLKKPDRQFVGFSSGEFISLKFPYNTIPENKERDFVFLCRGKYDPSDSLAPPKPETEPPLPKKPSLSQNYPNPFNPSTTIKFGLPTASNVRLEVFDIMGRSVAVLVDHRLNAGYHEIVWDGKNSGGGNVASGIYFYRLEANEFKSTKKMLILK